MDIPSVHPAVLPAVLRRGDVIQIVAPAGPIQQRDGLERGIAVLERMGFRTRFEPRIFESSRYLAGSDRDRAEELMRAFEDPTVSGVMALRGGYGCARLIPYLDESRLRPHPKVFIGFSDLTTLHLYFLRRFGWVTFHGPMAATPSLGSIAPDQEEHLLQVWTNPGYRPVLAFDQLEGWSAGSAEGILTGGCLSIIVSSIGTPYEIETEGRILFIEEVGELPYRLDRMLTHLRLAGKLDSVAGIVLGTFPDCDPMDGADQHSGTWVGYSALDVVREIVSPLGTPVLANFPAGHTLQNWALPLGSTVRIDADRRTLEITGPAVRS